MNPGCWSLRYIALVLLWSASCALQSLHLIIFSYLILYEIFPIFIYFGAEFEGLFKEMVIFLCFLQGVNNKRHHTLHKVLQRSYKRA